MPKQKKPKKKPRKKLVEKTFCPLCGETAILAQFTNAEAEAIMCNSCMERMNGWFLYRFTPQK